jgi:2-oxoglutarate ferredoxin oxidoreductase subunit alpha
VGVLRPITLYPFPWQIFANWPPRARVFAVVEMSNGQMVEDVRLALNGARPVEFLQPHGRQCALARGGAAFVRGWRGCRRADKELEEERMAHV